MNKDLTNVRLWKPNKRTRLFDALTSKSFHFPVVYTDGLISKSKKYRKNREPFGLLIDNSIVILQKNYPKKNYVEAEEFCSQIVFALKRASVVSWKKMVLINQFIDKFDETALELGFSELHGKFCWTNEGLIAHRVVHVGHAVQDYYAQSDRSLFCVLPQIDLDKPSSMIVACEA